MIDNGDGSGVWMDGFGRCKTTARIDIRSIAEGSQLSKNTVDIFVPAFWTIETCHV